MLASKKLVASKKRVNERFIPYVDYNYNTKDHKGEDTKVVSSIGFYEEERRKIYPDGRVGEVLKNIIVEAPFTKEGFKEVPYEGKTLILSIKNSKYTTSNIPATEEHKAQYPEAYQAFLNYKSGEEAKQEEVRKLKEQVEALEKEKAEKEIKSKK